MCPALKCRAIFRLFLRNNAPVPVQKLRCSPRSKLNMRIDLALFIPLVSARGLQLLCCSRHGQSDTRSVVTISPSEFRTKNVNQISGLFIVVLGLSRFALLSAEVPTAPGGIN